MKQRTFEMWTNSKLSKNKWGFPKVFGFYQDYIDQMRRRGHQVLYASVGPLSSNWDR